MEKKTLSRLAAANFISKQDDSAAVLSIFLSAPNVDGGHPFPEDRRGGQRLTGFCHP